MNLQVYLKEIEHAAHGSLELVWAERRSADALAQQVARLPQQVEHEYNAAASIMEDTLDADDYMLGVGRHWENYFGDDKERYHKNQLGRTPRRRWICIRSLLPNCLATSCTTESRPSRWSSGGLKTCPAGRLVGGVPLRDIIWQGRNQSNHWDDPAPKPPLVACFDTLAKNVDPAFGEYSKRNLGFDVLKLLGSLKQVRRRRARGLRPRPGRSG
jgi:hypothetical protein